MYCKLPPRGISKSFPHESIYKLKISPFTFCFLYLRLFLWEFDLLLSDKGSDGKEQKQKDIFLSSGPSRKQYWQWIQIEDWRSRVGELGTPQIIWLIKHFLRINGGAIVFENETRLEFSRQFLSISISSNKAVYDGNQDIRWVGD